MSDLILPSNTTRTDDLAALRTLAAGGTIGAMNYATGMGMPMYDPSRHADMGAGVIPLDRGQQDRLMRSHKFIRKIIEIIPNQMTYRWGNLTLGGDDGDPDIINDVHTWLDNLNTKSLVNRYKGLKRAFNQAMKMAFQTGNAALVILAKDGQNFDRPINTNNLRSIEGLFLADRWSIQPDISGIYANLEMAEYFWLNDSRFNKIIQLRGGDLGRIRIHRSRVLWFRGEELSDRTLLENEGCDDSVLQGIQQSFQEYFQAIRGAGRMIVDFDVVVHKVSGLYSKIDNDPKGQYQQKMMERAQINNICRSIWRSMLIDLEDEDIVHSTRNVSGYDSLLDRLVLDLQANTDLTKSELFNEMSKGLSATDKVEQENANNRTRMYQESKLDSNMYDFLKLVFACKDGPTQGKEPDKWEWKWQELYPVTPVEQAELELMRSQIDQINSSIGAYTGEEAAKSHYSGSEYNPEITIDWKEREKLKVEQEKQQAEADKLAIQMGVLPGMEQPLLPGQPKQKALPGQQPGKALPEASEATDSDDGFWPPLQVQAIARKGLDLFKQYGSPGKPNIMQSVFFARHMAYGQQIPRNAVFFIKQQNDLMRIPPDGDNPKHPSYEFIAYLCRGGAAGQAWIDQVVKELAIEAQNLGQVDGASIPLPIKNSHEDAIKPEHVATGVAGVGLVAGIAALGFVAARSSREASSGKGQPCGNSYISSSYQCRLGQNTIKDELPGHLREFYEAAIAGKLIGFSRDEKKALKPSRNIDGLLVFRDKENNWNVWNERLHPKKVNDRINDEELVGLSQYLGPAYKGMNSWLRTGEETPYFNSASGDSYSATTIRALSKAAYNGLIKIPPVGGEYLEILNKQAKKKKAKKVSLEESKSVLHQMQITNPKVLESFLKEMQSLENSDKNLVINKFLSTTFYESGSPGIKLPKLNVELMITPKLDGSGAGRLADPLKGHIFEAELLYPPMTQFKVKKISKRLSPRSNREIHVIEMEED